MATSVEIQCINRTTRTDPDDRIDNVGGVHSGKRWKLTLDQAIAGSEGGVYRFYSNVAGKSVWVIIATNRGRKYLKTEADGEGQNNLLSLPDCP